VSRHVVVIDNYDSFTYNLVYLLRKLGCFVDVVRNDAVTIDSVEKYSGIVLSPGPGIPSEAGVMAQVVAHWGPKKPLLGVCLGHQCIGEVFGARLINLSKVYHGKGILTYLSNENLEEKDNILFRGVSSPFIGARYHSWAIDPDSVPDDLIVTAHDEEGHIMAIQHRHLPVFGVQFHPESILTDHGGAILENWCRYTLDE
jgi:anthranilate synthase component II